MVETINNRTHLKALAKVTTLRFDIDRCKEDLRWDKGNGPLSTEQLQCCLRSAQREYEIWEYILKITTNEKN